MKCLIFASRNQKEISRDPLSVIFGIAFPILLLGLISLLTKNITGMPAQIFSLESFTPGMAVFSLSFVSLFLGTLISNDRKSSFLTRLFSSPLDKKDYILGYSLPMVWISVLQIIVCFIAAVVLGLEFSSKIFLAVLVLIPVSFLYIAIGLLLGTFCSPEQVGGMGSMIVSVSVLLSGTFFDLDAIKGGFGKFCDILPFKHAVDIVEVVLKGDNAEILPNLAYVLGYAVIIYIIVILFFGKQMRY